jgi:hypothetical protein
MHFSSKPSFSPPCPYAPVFKQYLGNYRIAPVSDVISTMTGPFLCAIIKYTFTADSDIIRSNKAAPMNISLDVDVLVHNGILVLTDREGKAISFSPEQTVQKKVSMITLGELCGLPKIRLAQAFGFKTRKSYYDIRDAVLNGLPADLLPKRTGPQNAPKRTKELESLIIRSRFESDLSMYEIAHQLTQLGFDVSARLVAQVLADYGLSKKNR